MISTTAARMRPTTRLETSLVGAPVTRSVSDFGSESQASPAPVGTCTLAWVHADATATSTDPVTKATRRARSSSP